MSINIIENRDNLYSNAFDWKIYLFYCIVNITLAYSIRYIVPTDLLIYQSLGEQLRIDKLEKVLRQINKYQWLGYTLLPLVILLRVFYTSIFLYIGVFFTELKIEFGRLLGIALLADFVYVLSGLAKLVILILLKEVNTLEDLQFQPLSLMELLNSNATDPLFVYPLSLVNVFELGYFLVLAWLLVGVINEANEERPVKFWQSFKLVLASYGSGLLLWVLVVMFITLNLS